MAMYDSFAAAFDAHAARSAYNAHYDRPALLELLGQIEGLRVLDAGCGSGLYSQELVLRGASVVGVDASGEMVRLASKRSTNQAQFCVHDLSEPLTWAASGSFDRVVMALVLHHLEDPQATLRELHRVLADDGQLLISTVHPTADWLRLGGSYFSDERVSETWDERWRVDFRRSSLEAIVADFSATGFSIDALVEPRPAESMATEFPEHYRKLLVEPAFIAFRLVKRRGADRVASPSML